MKYLAFMALPVKKVPDPWFSVTCHLAVVDLHHIQR